MTDRHDHYSQLKICWFFSAGVWSTGKRNNGVGTGYSWGGQNLFVFKTRKWNQTRSQINIKYGQYRSSETALFIVIATSPVSTLTAASPNGDEPTCENYTSVHKVSGLKTICNVSLTTSSHDWEKKALDTQTLWATCHSWWKERNISLNKTWVCWRKLFLLSYCGCWKNLSWYAWLTLPATLI